MEQRGWSLRQRSYAITKNAIGPLASQECDEPDSRGISRSAVVLKTIYARVREAFDMMENPPDLNKMKPLRPLLEELGILEPRAAQKAKRKQKHAG